MKNHDSQARIPEGILEDLPPKPRVCVVIVSMQVESQDAVGMDRRFYHGQVSFHIYIFSGGYTFVKPVFLAGQKELQPKTLTQWVG